MNFPRFFINRPIFAIVLSVLMLIAGAISYFQLPLSEYPQVTPPTVQVTASYPGANPQVIADTVASPLEQAINGVEGMMYMQSQMSTDGKMVLTVSFEQHINADIAQIQVQNRVSRALPRLPPEVQRIGVVTEKTSPDVLMVVHLLSPGGRYDPLYVSNYATLHVKDELARTPGVGDVLVWGAGEYSMRVWLEPAKVAARGLIASDVVAAIREQNIQVAAGSVGQQPDASAAFQVTVNTLGRLSSEEQFGEIVVKTGADGQVTRLRDVARISMGPIPTLCAACSMASRRWGYRSSRARARTRWMCLARCARQWTDFKLSSPTALSIGSPTTPRSSCAPRSSPSPSRCWRPSSWW